MRLKDLETTLNENMPVNVKHALPHGVIVPDMDLYYEFYKFVTNMACHPELENGNFDKSAMRDVPFAIAYTPQEFEMIKATAQRMGFDIEEVAFKGSSEPPETNTASPVMTYKNMFESEENVAERVNKLRQQFVSLLENEKIGRLSPSIENTISPTMTMPELVNSDTYKQYRYSLALAAARAVLAGDVEFSAESAWNEALTGIAYTPEELEIFKLANQMMGVNGVMLSVSPPTEPDDTYKVSPVMTYKNMFESETEKLRHLINLTK